MWTGKEWSTVVMPPPLPPAIIIYRGDESPREKSEKKIGITDAEGSGSSF